MQRRKGALVFAAKVLVATVLITFLVRSGTLDFGKLKVLWQSPLLLAADLGVWVACSIVIAVTRWRLLLSAVGARVSVGRAVMLQLTALFFNVVIPGNVGGDVVKALYVARGEPAERRTAILTIVFVERFIGLGGLVGTAALVTAIRFDVLWANTAFRPMVLTIAAFTMMFLVGPAIFVAVVRLIGARVERAVSGTTRIAKFAQQLVTSARLFADQPRVLLGALLLSMTLHSLSMFLFTVLTRELTGQQVSYGQIATVYPAGLLSMMIPIAPSGMGVGHWAFENLFSIVGLTGGATVFNVFLLGQIAPCLLGAGPYLSLRSELPTPPAAP